VKTLKKIFKKSENFFLKKMSIFGFFRERKTDFGLDPPSGRVNIMADGDFWLLTLK
jgi:hypothetical protein